MKSWVWPLSAPPLFPDEPGQFGLERAEGIHTGIDLYCEIGTEVFSVEDGEVIVIEWFTGQHVPTPDGAPSTWWNDTKIILVRGRSSVVGYGEVSPRANLKVGDKVTAGQKLGVISVAVLRSFKGRPMFMLHLELYSDVVEAADGTYALWWKRGTPQPETLYDPTPCLVDAASKGDPDYNPMMFRIEEYDGQQFRDFRAPCKDSRWWAMWGGDWQNPPLRRTWTHAAMVAVFDTDGRILLLKRHSEDRTYPGGNWGFPGGKLDLEETPLEAALREVFEETNLTVKVFATIGTREVRSPKGRLFKIEIFGATVVSGEICSFPTKEHVAAQWFMPDEVPSNLTGEATRWVIEGLLV